MAGNVPINALADAIMDTLEEYADLAAEDVKQAVKDAYSRDPGAGSCFFV